MTPGAQFSQHSVRLGKTTPDRHLSFMNSLAQLSRQRCQHGFVRIGLALATAAHKLRNTDAFAGRFRAEERLEIGAGQQGHAFCLHEWFRLLVNMRRRMVMHMRSLVNTALLDRAGVLRFQA